MSFHVKRGLNPPGITVLYHFHKSPSLVLKRDHRDVRFVISLLTEADSTVYERVKSVIFTHSHIQTWVVYSTSLTNEDVTCLYYLITEFLDTESFAM